MKCVCAAIAEKSLERKSKAFRKYDSAPGGKAGRMTAIAPAFLFVNRQYRDAATPLGQIIADIMEPDPAKIKGLGKNYGYRSKELNGHQRYKLCLCPNLCGFETPFT